MVLTRNLSRHLDQFVSVDLRIKDRAVDCCRAHGRVFVNKSAPADLCLAIRTVDSTKTGRSAILTQSWNHRFGNRKHQPIAAELTGADLIAIYCTFPASKPPLSHSTKAKGRFFAMWCRVDARSVIQCVKPTAILALTLYVAMRQVAQHRRAQKDEELYINITHCTHIATTILVHLVGPCP